MKSGLLAKCMQSLSELLAEGERIAQGSYEVLVREDRAGWVAKVDPVWRQIDIELDTKGWCGDCDWWRRRSRILGARGHSETVLAECDVIRGGIQHLSSFLLTLATAPGEDPVRTAPCHFHRRDFVERPNGVFLAMPFSPQRRCSRVARVIRESVAGLERNGERMTGVRADDLHGHDVMQDVYEHITGCSCVLVDTTSKNPNVFLELGMAIAFGKPLILMTEDPLDEIPFDLRRFRHFAFSSIDDRGLATLVKSVVGALEEVVGASAVAGVSVKLIDKIATFK